MTRLMFLLAALQGPRTFNRLAFLYVAGMLFLFFCLIGGWPHVPASPARPLAATYNQMPKPQPPPSNLADEMRKRTNNRQYGPR